MGTLYERIQSLCKVKGVSGGKMCTDLGISKSTLSDMKHGRTKGISIPTAQKIAGYFGMTVDELYGREPSENEEKPATTDGDRLSELQNKIMQEIQSAPEDLQKEFLNYLLFSKAQREK